MKKEGKDEINKTGNVSIVDMVARSHNHYCSGNTTMPSVCTVELHATVSNNNAE
jgi:hypothetical protein